MNIKVLALLMMATSTLLSGCMSIPVTTMYKVSQLSILSLNPDEIQVAVLTNEAENFPPFNHEYEFKPQEQVLSASASNIPAILKDDIEDNEKITILKFYYILLHKPFVEPFSSTFSYLKLSLGKLYLGNRTY